MSGATTDATVSVDGPAVAREKLAELLATYGRSILDDPRRFEALLRDLCGEHRREAHLLVSALRERIPTDLLAAANGIPKSLLISQLARRLHDHLGLAPALAHWAVETWALALGVVAEGELALSGQTLAPTSSTHPPVYGGSQRGGGELVVAPSGAPYQSIADAVRHAPVNARILVQPGHYFESLVLDKSVEIVGTGLTGQTVIESIDRACLVTTAPEAAVRGLTLVRRGMLTGGAAVDVTEGRLVLDDCSVTAQARACIAVGGRGTTLVARRCQVHAGADTGILFYHEASGVVEDCDIVGHATNGVQVAQGANPLFRRCQVRDGREVGVLVNDGGRGAFEGCDILDNGFQGVLVTGGETSLNRCRVQRNLYGVWVERGGTATVEHSDLRLNRERAWQVKAGATVRQRGNNV